VWYSNSGTEAKTDVQEVTRSEEQLSFTSPDTTSWIKGTYRVDIWVGDAKIGNTAFVLL
jgi:hypothetical protein